MLSDFIFSDNISVFVLIVFVLMIVIGVGVFIFLFKQLTKQSDEKVETFHENYDGIVEKNNPTPYGMHIVMICTILFSGWYIFMGFPLFHHEQSTQYEAEVSKHNANFTEKWKDADQQTLLAMGESIFNTQCIICHGISAEGQGGMAANLIEFGNEAHIIYVIKNGSMGLNKLTPSMPPQFEIFGETDELREKGARDVAAYLITLSGRKPSSEGDTDNGKALYMMSCFACHGEDGKGRGPTGDIPNFAADLTQYGSPDYIREIVVNGKKGLIGEMPAFGKTGVLSDIQFKAVSEYVANSLN